MENRYQEYPLWSTAVPFAEVGGSTPTEHFLADQGDGIERLTNVVNPSVTYYPVSGKGPHPAVLVCPGGGYGILAWNHEGIDICSFFNSIGFSAFLLKYRCPDRRTAAHADAARAIRFIRANAEKFNISGNKVGVLGFSAGAHLAATVSAPANDVPYEPLDSVDEYSYRPNFTALIYPAYLSDDKLNPAPEFKFDSNVPPTFLLQTEDDGIQVENALAWFWALKKSGIKAELHCYAEGGHGYGLLPTGKPVSGWPLLVGDWFRREAGLS